MATVILQLRKLPAGYGDLRAMAPRADDFDTLDSRYTMLGFSPRASVGDTTATDLHAIGMTVASLPLGVEIVEAVRLLQPQSARPSFNFAGLRAGPGDVVHVPVGQGAAAIAAGLAVAA